MLDFKFVSTCALQNFESPCRPTIKSMADFDVISLSSDSSRPSSPFINVSEIFNNSEKPNNRSSPVINFDKSLTTCVSPSKTASLFKNRIVHNLSESEDSENEINAPSSSDLSCGEINRLLNKYSGENNFKTGSSKTDASDDPFCNVSNKVTLTRKELANRNKRNGEPNINMTKEQKQEEKLRKQIEKEQKKAEKLATKELQNHMKPGNCLKYMMVMLDSSLTTCSFGGMLIAAIQNSESKCHISTHITPYSILWKRELPGSKEKEENDLVVIWDWQTAIPAIKTHTLCSKIQEIQAHYLGKSVYFVLYGLNGYFSYLKRKRRNNSEDLSKRRRMESKENDFPYVTRKEIEEELIELQIMTNCNHRTIESAEDLGKLIVQITKAIAETPFKQDKQRRELESLEWFAVGDSRDCVTVDKAGNGLLRLWQQQLCQFNLAGHDVAQAIASVYPSPQALIMAYDKCSSQREAEELLKDIPVRRCQGPLSSSRRIGPELSKKICIFFSSTDGDAPLSQEM